VEAQNGGKNWSQKLGETSAQNWGKVAPDFDSRFGGIEATDCVLVHCLAGTFKSLTVPHRNLKAIDLRRSDVENDTATVSKISLAVRTFLPNCN